MPRVDLERLRALCPPFEADEVFLYDGVSFKLGEDHLLVLAPSQAQLDHSLAIVLDWLEQAEPLSFCHRCRALLLTPFNIFGWGHYARGDYELAIAAALSFNLAGAGTLYDYFVALVLPVLLFILNWLGRAAATLKLKVRMPSLPRVQSLYIFLASVLVPWAFGSALHSVMGSGGPLAAVMLVALGKLPPWPVVLVALAPFSVLLTIALDYQQILPAVWLFSRYGFRSLFLSIPLGVVAYQAWPRPVAPPSLCWYAATVLFERGPLPPGAGPLASILLDMRAPTARRARTVCAGATLFAVYVVFTHLQQQ